MRTKRQALQAWSLWSQLRLLYPREIVDPGAPGRVMRHVKGMILSDAARDPSQFSRDWARAFSLLPRRLQADLLGDDLTQEALGLAAEIMHNVGDLRFVEADYLRAAAAARKEGSAMIETSDGITRVMLRDASVRGEIRLSVCGAGVDAIDDSVVLATVATTIEECLGALKKSREALDLSENELLEFAKSLIAGVDPRARAQLLRDAVLSSPRDTYEQIARVFERLRNVDDLLPSAADTLLRYLRIPSKLQPRDFESGAANVLAAFGIDEALRRYVYLPVGLPQSLCEVFMSLSDAEARKAYLRLLFVRRRNPLAVAHAAALAAQRGWGRAAASCIRRLLGLTLGGVVESHRVAVWWAVNEITRWKLTNDWTDAARLAVAWQHGGMLWDAWFAARLKDNKPRIMLTQTRALFEESLYSTDALLLDAAHPRNIDPSGFFALGIAMAAGETSENLLDQVLTDAFLAALTNVYGDAKLPAPFTLTDERTQPNVLGSWLGAPRDTVFARVVPMDYSAMSGRGRSRFIANRLSQLKKNPDDYISWFFLKYVLGERGPTTRKAEAKLREVIENVDLARFEDVRERMNVSHLCCCWAYRVGGASLRDRVTSALFAATPDLTRLAPEEIETVREGFIASIMRLVQAAPLENRFAELARIFTRGSSMRPEVWEVYGRALETIRRRADPVRAAQLEDVIINSRAS